MKYLFFLGLFVSPVLVLSWLPSPLPDLAAGQLAAPPGPADSTPAEDELPAGVAVLELFTSQGCSSCPPADRLLAQYAQSKEENVIALSFHVDYWNQLGWKDPYSSPWFSARQTDYTDRLLARTYTPQLIVNGSSEMIGSRKSEVATAVKRALETPMLVDVDLRQLPGTPEKVAVAVDLSGSWQGMELTAALVQKKVTTEVKRGENRGRILAHHQVVRSLKKWEPRDFTKGDGILEFFLPEGMTKAETAVVVLVAQPAPGKIVGARLLWMSAG